MSETPRTLPASGGTWLRDPATGALVRADAAPVLPPDTPATQTARKKGQNPDGIMK